MTTLFDVAGRPLPPSCMSSPSLDAGTSRGTTGDHYPPRTIFPGEHAAERKLSTDRVEDLYLNTSVAKSAVNSIAACAVGTGLEVESCLPWERLGMDQEAAVELQDQMEWLWTEWCAEAHQGGILHFADLQLLAIKSLIRNGEMLHLPVMEEREGSRFGLRIQDLKPARLRTPFGREHDTRLRDGVELSATGQPAGYWIACPQTPLGEWSDATTEFVRIPACIGHRPGLFHIFQPDFEEQYRGMSQLAASFKNILHLDNAIEIEQAGQEITAAVTGVVQLDGGVAAMPGAAQLGGKEKRYAPVQEVRPGQIAYINKGEKFELLESKRPNANFLAFCEMVLRMIAASLGIPYEVLAKDFTKTTFSSARAALLEAWRVYKMYRRIFVRYYCQPVWQMVMEEAVLRGYLKLPVSLDAFYTNIHLWCSAKWIGPAQGYIDPTTEIAANKMAVDAGFMTISEAIAERGADPDEVFSGLAREQRRLKQLGVVLPQSGSTPAPLPDEDEDSNAKKTPEAA